MYNEKIIPSVSNSTIHIEFQKKVTQNEKIVPWHFHNELEFFWLTNGQKIFCSQTETIEMEKGDIIVVNRRVPHQTKTPVGSAGMLLQLNNTVMLNEHHFDQYVLQTLHNSPQKMVLFPAGSPGHKMLCPLISKIGEEFLEKKPSYELYIKGYVLELLATLYRQGVLPDPAAVVTPEKLSRMLPALGYINEHYAESISLQKVSELLKVDKSHFCRLFKSATQTTFLNYLNFVRVLHAEVLLRDTDCFVSEIAYSVGFSSASYFTEMFHQFNGCTPTVYRKMISHQQI